MKETILIIGSNEKQKMALSYAVVPFYYKVIFQKTINESMQEFSFDKASVIFLLDEQAIIQNIKKVRSYSNGLLFILTSNVNHHFIEDAFELGVDDIFTTSISYSHIFLKVKAILNRYNHHIISNIVRYQTLEIDYCNKSLLIDNKQVHLSITEFALIAYLVSNQNQIISRQELYKNIWNKHYQKGERTIDTHIFFLRKKLGKYSKNIVLKHGYGYAFVTDK